MYRFNQKKHFVLVSLIILFLLLSTISFAKVKGGKLAKKAGSPGTIPQLVDVPDSWYAYIADASEQDFAWNIAPTLNEINSLNFKSLGIITDEKELIHEGNPDTNL